MYECSHSSRRQSRPWHSLGGRGGLYITEALFMLVLARFAPECRCARVGGRLQAVRGDWDEPKAWVVAKDRNAK